MLNPTAASAAEAAAESSPARKSLSAVEQAASSVPVVWIQTGPGKFVRVEGGRPAANSAEIENDSPQSLSGNGYPSGR